MIKLNEYLQKVKYWAEENRSDLLTAGIIFFVGMAGFGLGRLSVLWPEKEPIRIIEPAQKSSQAIDAFPQTQSKESGTPRGVFVASKNGAYFHYPWCSGARRIKEENMIWFGTKEEAIARGYKAASNCPGL